MILYPAKTKASGLFSGSATYLASNILNAVIPFALLPVLTRYLSTTEYGQVAMFQTLVAALAALTGVNTQGAANRKYYDADITHQELAHFVGACVQILFMSSILIFFAIFICRQSLANWLGLKTSWILWAVAVSTAGFLINLRLGQWQIRKLAFKYSALQVSQGFMNATLSLVLVVIFYQGAAGRITAQIWVVPSFAILAVYILIKDQLLSVSWRPDYIREALQFGVPLIPHVVGLFLLTAVDRLVINTELGLSEAGIYMVAVQVTMVMALLFDAINKAYVPWLFEHLKRDRHEEKKLIVRWTYLYFIVAIVIAGLAFALGPYAIEILAGPGYAQAGKIVGWLALGQAFSGMYLMVTNYVFYSKKTGLLSLSTIGSGALGLGLLILFVKPFGLIGAAWAFAIAMATRFFLTWTVAQKRHPMPWFDF